MKTLLILTMVLLLSGCGDTINQSAPTPAQNKLIVNSSSFWIYSTSYPSVTVDGVVTKYASNYFAQGNIGYEGDPQGTTLSMRGDLNTYYPPLSIIADKHLFFSFSIQPPEVQKLVLQNSFNCVLTDPHGNDSNWFPMFLRP